MIVQCIDCGKVRKFGDWVQPPADLDMLTNSKIQIKCPDCDPEYKERKDRTNAVR